MEKLIFTLLVATTSLAAFAQGKISFANDSLHLYYLNPSPSALSFADSPLAGQPIPLGGTLPSGITMVSDLYAGLSSGSLSYVTTATFSGTTVGRQNTVNLTLSGIPGGLPAFFQVRLRDSSIPIGFPPSYYSGVSDIFTAVPSTTIAFNSIVNHGGTALSTWADGTFALPGLTFGAIMIPAYIPEPSSLALTGLGISALLLRRNRNPEV